MIFLIVEFVKLMIEANSLLAKKLSQPLICQENEFCANTLILCAIKYFIRDYYNSMPEICTWHFFLKSQSPQSTDSTHFWGHSIHRSKMMSFRIDSSFEKYKKVTHRFPQQCNNQSLVVAIFLAQISSNVSFAQKCDIELPNKKTLLIFNHLIRLF